MNTTRDTIGGTSYNLCEYPILDIEKIVTSITPSYLFDFITISYDLFSAESCELLPCQRAFISSGLRIKPYISTQHSVFFQGFINSNQIQTLSKHISTTDVFDVCVAVVNYSDTVKVIPMNMPLGQILIRSNQHSIM
jgi:hypothetical protein